MPSDRQMTDQPEDADKPTVAMCQACGQPPAECQCITLKELAELMGITWTS
jgi:hypothetical protein